MTKPFKTKSISFWIKENSNSIILQAGNNGEVNAEGSFTIDQLKEVSVYFSLFTSIQEITKEFMTLAEGNMIDCIEKQEGIDMVLNINFKAISKIQLGLARLATNEELKYNEMERRLNVKIDAIQSLLVKQTGMIQMISDRLDKIEAKLKDSSQLEYFLKTSQSYTEIGSKSLRNTRDIKVNLNQCYEAPYSGLKTTVKSSHLRQKSSQLTPETSSLYAKLNETPCILKEEEKSMISKWISNDKPIKWKLVYHPMKGDDIESKAIKAFYMKSPLLVLIKTTTGNIFGGYTSVGWDIPPGTKYSWKSDPNAFLFSVNLKKKYHIKPEKVDRAIFCRKGDIAAFCYGITLTEGFMSSKDNWTDLFHYGNNDPQYELNKGSESFTVRNLYVYQIVTQ